MKNNAQITFDELDMITGGGCHTIGVPFLLGPVFPELREVPQKNDDKPKDGGATYTW
jgi:hypothetical protein